jgi:hypothetical protein
MAREAAVVPKPYRWLIAFLALVVAVSFIPLTWKVWLGTHGPLHALVHFVVFVVAGVLANVSARSVQGRLWRAAGLVVMAVLLEGGQWLIFGNEFEVPDLKTDTTGVITALVISQLIAAGNRVSARR